MSFPDIVGIDIDIQRPAVKIAATECDHHRFLSLKRGKLINISAGSGVGGIAGEKRDKNLRLVSFSEAYLLLSPG